MRLEYIGNQKLCRRIPELAIRVSRRGKAVDVIDTIKKLLKLYPEPTHLRIEKPD
jgi:hypothetical protein